MSTAIARQAQESSILARFGTDWEIATYMQRAAAIFQIPPEEVNRPDVQASLTKATQYCINFGYLPGVHVHMIPFGKKIKVPNPQNPNATIDKWIDTYAPDLGEKAWKDSANRQSQMQGFSYVVDIRAMTAEEVLAETARIPAQQYDPADAGCYARVLRSDHAALFKQVGRPYDPEWVTGFWRKKARERQGTWYADNVPVQRTPGDVAMRRATKAALMAVFQLVPLNDYTESQRARQLSAYVQEATAEMLPISHAEIALPANGRYYRDEEGELWDGEQPGDSWEAQKPILMAEERAKMATEAEPTITSLDDVDEMDWNSKAWDIGASEIDPFRGQEASKVGGQPVDKAKAAQPVQPTKPVTPEFVAFANGVVEWALKTQRGGDTPCSEPQYGYLVSVINKITGVADSHHSVLSVLTGRPTSSENRVDKKLAGELLDYLTETKTVKSEDGTKTQVKNEKYKATYVAVVKWVHGKAATPQSAWVSVGGRPDDDDVDYNA